MCVCTCWSGHGGFSPDSGPDTIWEYHDACRQEFCRRYYVRVQSISPYLHTCFDAKVVQELIESSSQAVAATGNAHITLTPSTTSITTIAVAASSQHGRCIRVRVVLGIVLSSAVPDIGPSGMCEKCFDGLQDLLRSVDR